MYEVFVQDLRGCEVLVPGYRGKLYNKQERARAILLDRVPLEAFVLAFVWGGVPYYKKLDN